MHGNTNSKFVRMKNVYPSKFTWELRFSELTYTGSIINAYSFLRECL
jgi:hypothetical protein